MNNSRYLSKLLEKLNEYKFYINNENSETQKSSFNTEKFTENSFLDVFGDKIKIFKNGSQEHPDFYIINKLKYEEISNKKEFEIEFIKREKNKIKSFKNLIDKYFDIDDILKVEVKSYKTKNGYMIFNDSFPNPNLEKDVIYVFYSFEDKKVFISSSYFMAKNDDREILEKYIKSIQNIKEAQLKSNEIWKDSYTKTTIRPTYSINKKYFNFNSKEMDDKIENKLKKIVDYEK